MTHPSTPPANPQDPGESTAAPDSIANPRRRWDVIKTELVSVGAVLIVLSILSSGAWFPFGFAHIPTRPLAFGTAFVVLLVGLQGGMLAYLSGRWHAIWGWAIGTLLVLAALMIGLNLIEGSLPPSLAVPFPRAAMLIAGIVAGVIGLSRQSDVLHCAESDPDDWFTRTSRILQAVHFWTADQAHEQMRRARAEFDHAQSHRTQGTEQLTPTEHFGAPEEYAASLRDRPSTTTDPFRSGRWYYLTTAIVLGAWALFRSYALRMGWLTTALFFLAVVALGMFVWVSVASDRHR